MKTYLRQLKWHQIIFLLALLFGGLVRLAPVIISDFPINDGGMFYTMIQELFANGFRLPATTSYNLSSIPYFYPPLGFYLVAALHFVTRLPEITLLRWLPACINIASIPMFYKMATCVFKRPEPAALASAFYALLPGSYSWFIMGGGLSRSLGGFFLLFSVYALLKLFELKNLKYLLLTAMACSMAILSHPEVALHTAAICALTWLLIGRSWGNSLRAAAVAGITAILTSVWWIPLLIQHGVQPILSAFHSGYYGTPILLAWLRDFLALATYIPIVTVLRLMGAYAAIRQKNYFLIAWMVLPYLTEPRSAAAISLYPFALMAGLGWEELIKLIRTLFKKREKWAAALANIQTPQASLLLLVGMFYLFVECAFYSFTIAKTVLPDSARQAFIWVEANTPADSKFLVLTGNQEVMVDAVQEWFPSLTYRHSISTLQGLEWTLADQFNPRVSQLSRVQACRTMACVEEWTQGGQFKYTYLMVMKNEGFSSLIVELQVKHKPLYENEAWIIYE